MIIAIRHKIIGVGRVLQGARHLAKGVGGVGIGKPTARVTVHGLFREV